jgi:ribonuclease J
VKVCIHRGAREIGGNCVEVEAQGERIVLDVGRPLDAVLDEDVPLPPVAGLSAGDDRSLAGVIISHSHQDHWGLARKIALNVPLFMGAAAHRILQEAAFFSPAGADLNPAGFLQDRQPFQFGPFRITPYLVVHSAFDAYALLIDAEGRRLFYTGDYRGHGRKSVLFARFVRQQRCPEENHGAHRYPGATARRQRQGAALGVGVEAPGTVPARPRPGLCLCRAAGAHVARRGR